MSIDYGIILRDRCTSGIRRRGARAMTAHRLDFRFLEAEMKAQGKTLKDLEAETGISDSTISRIFRDQVQEPRASQVMMVAAALGLEFHVVMRRAGLAIPDPAAPSAEAMRQAVALDADPDLAGLLRAVERLRPADRDAVRAYMALLEAQRQARSRPPGRTAPRSGEESR